MLVRDHIPLEQGLRPLQINGVVTVIVVRDHIPLEQGLRQSYLRQSHEVHKSETIFH